MTILNEIMLNVNSLKALNTLTKYPSILTYHNLGERGSLVDSLVEDTKFDDRDVYITEKIDGTNSRAVIFTDRNGSVEDYLIGSREDLLHAKGDRIIIDTLGIVANMKSVADTIALLGEEKLEPNTMYCVYGETYGGKINAHKQYSGHNAFGLRIFDMFKMSVDTVKEMVEWDVAAISSWREHAGQPFVSVDQLEKFCHEYSLTRVPYLKIISGTQIPETLQGVWDWMQAFKGSVAALDTSALGMSEGIVVRYSDRSLIRKIRFEDYMRTKKRGLIK